MTDRLSFLGFHRLFKQIRPSPRAIISHHTHHCHHCAAAGCWAGIPHSTAVLRIETDICKSLLLPQVLAQKSLPPPSTTWAGGANQPRQSQYLLHLGFQSDQLTFPPRNIGNGCELEFNFFFFQIFQLTKSEPLVFVMNVSRLKLCLADVSPDTLILPTPIN